MRSSLNKQLPHAEWPRHDQSLWEAAFRTGKFLDDDGEGHISRPRRGLAFRVPIAAGLGTWTDLAQSDWRNRLPSASARISSRATPGSFG
jgi:hypothetical protein